MFILSFGLKIVARHSKNRVNVDIDVIVSLKVILNYTDIVSFQYVYCGITKVPRYHLYQYAIHKSMYTLF